MNATLATTFRLCVFVVAHASFSAWTTFADEPQERRTSPAGGDSKPGELTALLLSVRHETVGPEQMSDLMLREIARQAFLIAARDELQIPTRDVVLRETLPAGIDLSKMPLSLSVVITGDVKAPLDSERAELKVHGTEDEPIWRRSYELAPEHFIEQWTERCEQLSRTEFPNVLVAGASPKAKRAEMDLPVSDVVSRQLDEMELVGQFAAVREIHGLIRRDGHSPQRLGALVRGYANLGLLSNSLVGPEHKVFTARSLLYAERLCVAEDTSPWALWHRAYARALAGLHLAAIGDLEAAKKRAEDSAAPPPEWVSAIDALCRFDESGLSGQAERTQLGAALRLHSISFSNRNDAVLTTAQALLERCPDCYFAIDSIYQTLSLGTSRHAADLGPQVAARWLPVRLSALGGAPANLVLALPPTRAGRGDALNEKGTASRLQLIQGLRAAGALEADEGEPSWSALAAIVEDVTFLHAMRQIDFYGDMLAVPIEDMLESLRPLVADHPLRALIDAQSKQMQRRREAAKAISATDGIDLYLEDTAEPLYNALFSVDDKLWKRLNDAAYSHNDRVFYDVLRVDARHPLSPEMRPYLASTLMQISPHAPISVALQIKYNWAAAQELAGDWEQQYASSPVVLNALGTQYVSLKQFDDAERCLKKSIDVAPDLAAYHRLAELYWQKGDVDAWKAALDESLEQEAFGLEHAQTRVRIANYFILQKEFDKALEYAHEAAQTGASWALACESVCWEGKQDWNRAKRLIRFNVERYDNIPFAWIYFCKRTGYGDVKAATRLAESYIGRAERKEVNADPLDLGGAYILIGQPEKAIPVFREHFLETKNPSPGILAALLADQLSHDQARDELLAQVIAEGPTFKENGKPRVEMLQLAQWFIDDLKDGGKGDHDLGAIDTLLADAVENEQLICDHLLGRYLSQHGKRDQAIEYWKRVMASPRLPSWHRSLVGNSLNELGLGPKDLQQELLSKPKQTKKADDKKQ